MRFKYFSLALLLLSSFAFGLRASAENITPKDKQKLEVFLKRRLGGRLPGDAKIDVRGYEKSPIQGFKKGTFVVQHSGGSGEVSFLISQDGKYVIFGNPVDTQQFENTQMPEIKKGTIPLGGQTVPILMTKNGRYIILGELFNAEENPLKETMDQISLKNVPVKGDKNAKVTIVEYSDFQCPFCSKASDMLPKILQEYKGKVKIFYKQFPLPTHQWAMNAAIASVCTYRVGGNDSFWKFHDLVFDKQQEITDQKSKEQLKGIAKQLGVDEKKYDACLNSPDVAARVQSDINEGQSIGVNSTPTFIINGLPVPGADYDRVKAAIEANLSGNI
ncbi:MAG TPA: DsbA family protein [Thermodesulfobacteriota bacterium]|nr:DsbA family protein [Thermodesulfobacteriota bacterium]